MSQFQPILICPLCQEQYLLTREEAYDVIGGAIHRGDTEVRCRGCNWYYSSKINVTFKPISAGSTSIY